MQALYDTPVDADRSATRWPGFVHISMITWNSTSEISRFPRHGVPLALREGLLTTFVSVKYRSGSSTVSLSSWSAFRVRGRGSRLNRSSFIIPVFTRRTTEKLYVCDCQTQSVSMSSRVCDIDEKFHVQYVKSKSLTIICRNKGCTSGCDWLQIHSAFTSSPARCASLWSLKERPQGMSTTKPPSSSRKASKNSKSDEYQGIRSPLGIRFHSGGVVSSSSDVGIP